jgi:uncharacterized membrane protein
MKFSPHLLCIAAAASIAARGETLIIPTGLGGTLLVASNQTAFISHYQYTSTGVSYYPKIVSSGVTNSLLLNRSSLAPTTPGVVSGPVEIQFLPSVAHFLNYKLVQATSIKTFIARYGETNTIEVPTNKSVRFFQRIPKYGEDLLTMFTVIQGTNSFSISAEDLNLDLTGPLTISVTTPDGSPSRVPPEAAVFSYVIQEGGSIVTPQGVLQVPSSAALRLEKSTDLQKWLPAAVIEKQAEPAAFYRLKSN